MAGLKTIKTKIRSIEKTQTVTRAMEAVSASKMRKAQNKALAGRTYARAALSILARVSGSRDLANHPLVKEGAVSLQGNASGNTFSSPQSGRNVADCLYIVITSDKGLAGGLNSGVLRAVEKDIQASAFNAVSIIAVGRKAYDFFTTRGFVIAAYHPNTDVVTAELVEGIVVEAAQHFATGETNEVKVAYQNFISTFEQRPTLRTVFPLSLGELSNVVGDIVPAKGALVQPVDQLAPVTHTVEPSAEEVLNVILPKLASIFVYHALLESLASEHSARMVSMKSASDKAGEMEHALTLQFNKARQAAITREVSEITGGMEAMSTN